LFIAKASSLPTSIASQLRGGERRMRQTIGVADTKGKQDSKFDGSSSLAFTMNAIA
jgi:hypothetical protein